MMNTKRILAGLLSFGLIGILCLSYADHGHVGPPTIGPKTTVAQGPVNQDGYLDYFAAENERRAHQIAPENNAALELICISNFRQQSPELFNTAWKLLTANASTERLSLRQATGNIHFLDFGSMVSRKQKRDRSEQTKDKQTQAPTRPTKSRGIKEHEELFDKLESAFTTPWSKEKFPLVDLWIKENTPALELAHAAAAKQDCWFPILNLLANEEPTPLRSRIVTGAEQDMYELLDRGSLVYAALDHVQELRGLSRCLVARAMRHLHEVKVEACQDDLMAVRRIAAHLEGQGGFFVETLIAASLGDLAFVGEQQMYTHPSVTLGQLERYEKMLGQLPVATTLTDSLNGAERFSLLSSAQSFHIHANASFDIDLMLKIMNDFCDRQIASLNDPTAVESKRFREEFQKRRRGKPKGLAFAGLTRGRTGRTEVISENFLKQIASDLESLATSCSNQRCQIDILRCAIAIKSYQNENGELPASLNDLPPEVPTRDWTRQPDDTTFHYLTDGESFLLTTTPKAGLKPLKFEH